MAPWEAIVRDLHGALAPAGLDLVAATTVSAYHAALTGAAREALALPAEHAPDDLVVCVGNTRALWPALLAAMDEDAALAASPDPVDDHAGAALRRATVAVAARRAVALAAYPVRESGPPSLAIVALAEAAGLGTRAPCHLLVHGAHGPWVALRGAVVARVAGPPPSPRAPGPCDACAAKPCVAAYERAVHASGGAAGVTRETLARDHALWVAVRDACPVGRASRYDDAQAEYHYTKRRSLLPLTAPR